MSDKDLTGNEAPEELNSPEEVLAGFRASVDLVEMSTRLQWEAGMETPAQDNYMRGFLDCLAWVAGQIHVLETGEHVAVDYLNHVEPEEVDE